MTSKLEPTHSSAGAISSKTKSVTSYRSKPIKAVHNLMSLPSSLMSNSRFGSSSSSSKKSIKFYNRDEPYYEFTNFYPATVTIDDQRWPTTEHYFQAQKFVGTPYLELIRGFSSAREAFQLSRNSTVSQWRRSDWDAVKDDIMLKALRCKFTQHKDLRKLLWETGDRELIEHTSNDSYWADGGGRGRGLNKLGKLLMKVRDDIVAVCGPYVEPVKKNSSSKVSRSSLRRSSSLSDLSRQPASKEADLSPLSAHNTDDFLSLQLQSTTLPPTSSRLKRSSSFSTMLPSYDSSSSYSSYTPSKSSYDGPLVGRKMPTSTHPTSSSTHHTRSSMPYIKSVMHDYQPQLTSKSKRTISDHTKGTQHVRLKSTSKSYSSPVSSQPIYKQSGQLAVHSHTNSSSSNKNTTSQSKVGLPKSLSSPPTSSISSPDPPSYKYSDSYSSRLRPRPRNPVTGADWY